MTIDTIAYIVFSIIAAALAFAGLWVALAAPTRDDERHRSAIFARDPRER